MSSYGQIWRWLTFCKLAKVFRTYEHVPRAFAGRCALDLAQETGWPRAREMVQIHGFLAHFSASFISSMVYQANKTGCRKKRVYNKYISPVELMTKSQEMPLLWRIAHSSRVAIDTSKEMRNEPYHSLGWYPSRRLSGKCFRGVQGPHPEPSFSPLWWPITGLTAHFAASFARNTVYIAYK